MIYGITVETLTEEQLDALAIINPEVAKVERERRIRESKFNSLEEVCEVAAAAYCLLRPMYDNMRNTDTKKIITSSGIIEMLEKLIRTKGDEPIKEAIARDEEGRPKLEGIEWFCIGGPEKAAEKVEENNGWSISDIEKPELVKEIAPFDNKEEEIVRVEEKVEDIFPEITPGEVKWVPFNNVEEQPSTEIAPDALANNEIAPVAYASDGEVTTRTTISQDKLTEILNSIPVVGA